MAKFEKMIPYILHWETGLNPKYLGLPPEDAYAAASVKGFHTITGDTGGPTMCGVTLATYEAYCRRKGYPRPTVERLKKLPYEQWREIFKSLFWDRCKADGINDEWVAMAIVDWAWISGAGILKKVQSLVGVATDGVVGPQTLQAINRQSPRELLSRIVQARSAHMNAIANRNPSQRKFLNGWLRRARSIEYGAFKI